MWKNTDLQKMVTVVISFYRGVTLERDAALTIPEEGGLHLEVEVRSIDRRCE
jgi:hypothetical protein